MAGKHYMHLQDRQKGWSGELQAGQQHWSPWEDYGANPPGSYFQVHERQENYKEQLKCTGVNTSCLVYSSSTVS